MLGLFYGINLSALFKQKPLVGVIRLRPPEMCIVKQCYSYFLLKQLAENKILGNVLSQELVCTFGRSRKVMRICECVACQETSEIIKKQKDMFPNDMSKYHTEDYASRFEWVWNFSMVRHMSLSR